MNALGKAACGDALSLGLAMPATSELHTLTGAGPRQGVFDVMTDSSGGIAREDFDAGCVSSFNALWRSRCARLRTTCSDKLPCRSSGNLTVACSDKLTCGALRETNATVGLRTKN